MPCAAAAAATAGANARHNATRAEEVRQRAEENLRREQQSMSSDGGTPGPPKISKTGTLHDMAMLKLKEKKVVGGLEGLNRPLSQRAEEVMGKERIYQSTALFFLKPGDEPRRSTIFLVESKPFDPIILITIICNCCTMGWESPLDPCCTDKADFIAVCEWVYLIIFTFEMFSKILAYGFLPIGGNSTAYLTDAWCQLDITVVSLAWLPILFPSFGNYSVIRSVRALRPLRALKRVPGMPVLVSSIMAAFPKMGNVAALCAFVFLVFGIVGMELFKGSMHYRCAYDGFEETLGHPVARRLQELAVDGAAQLLLGGGGGGGGSASPLSSPSPLSPLLQDGRDGGAAHAHAVRQLKGGGGNSASGGADALAALLNYTGNQADYDNYVSCQPGAGMCPDGTFCAYFDLNPNYGITSFDSTPVAFIAILQVAMPLPLSPSLLSSHLSSHLSSLLSPLLPSPLPCRRSRSTRGQRRCTR